ncbi:hypothetical protein ANCCAN_14315 [Ancylostoma caninum]|uniref:Uncharacterized protein n=1 Tax=Ancylostoma caninum TaxID=29170 RepID=A0A368G5P5_ANCCA|nr:hypothetical protein ANCCAN_14315 [Ancylostoma caninum]
MDLFRVCPEELSSEPVKPMTRRRQRRGGKVAVMRVKAERTFECKESNTFLLRSDREFDVNDEMHCLHGRFRCQGQPLPLLEELPQMDMSQCNCARVIAIWQDCGTLAEKVAWIQDPFHRRITPESMGYAFFRSRCLHLSVMAGTIPSDGIMRNALISGWSCDITQIFEMGWRIATRISWKVAQSAVDQEHRKLLIVVPETLHRLKFAAQGMKNTKVFYYSQFREIHLMKTELFDDNLGKVIVLLPSLEPKPGTWLPLVHAWNMWLHCGCRVFLIAGPRPQDENSWYRVATQARVHMNGFLECHPELVPQVVDKLIVENGVIDHNSPAYAVAVRDDNDAWLPERQMRLFYEYLTRQSAPYLTFDNLPVHSQRPRRSVLTGEPSTTSRDRGYPAIKEGVISKRVQR